jgi:hypothetical protein
VNDWTTRVEPKLTQQFGVNELHTVCFEPPGWPGKGTVLALGIPECELQFMFPAADGQPVAMINRPQKNKSIKGWLRFVCKEAAQHNAFLILSCDTAEQAAVAANQVTKFLPHYRRVALERMYDAKSRVHGNLS